MSSKVVYTAIFNNYDILIDPKNPSEDVEYICFTDRQTEINSDIWKRVVVEDIKLPANMKNRLIKMKPHKFLSDFDRSLYIDGNVVLQKDVNEIFQKYSDEKMVVPSHPDRDCIYEEAEALKNTSKGDDDKISRQMKRYKEEDFPKNYGLSANRIILREHNNPEVVELMKDWWRELFNGAKRDQLSLSYVTWINEFEISYMEENAGLPSTDIFDLAPHKGTNFERKFNKVYIPILVNRNKSKAHKFGYYCLRSFQILVKRGPKSLIKTIISKIK